MIDSLFIFIVSMFLVIKGAEMATKYSAKLAEIFNLSKYVIGFIIVAVISILPETFISINSALENVPSFGLSVLFGSNVADLTLVFAIIILIAQRGIKIESKIIKNNFTYPLLILLPLVLGVNGNYSRMEGLALIIAGSVFYYMVFKNSPETNILPKITEENHYLKNFLCLIGSMAVLLIGSHFTVTSATSLATSLKINPILIGMLLVGVGTTLPELFFSLKAVKKQDDDIAVGDILGTVLADATIVVGIIALINPFSFPTKIIYITGLFMVGASILILHFMRSGQTLSKKESYWLLIYWLIFVVIEFLVSK
ncbi:MAG: sodium:calcium antiporter [Minisyncoccota bacterium]